MYRTSSTVIFSLSLLALTSLIPGNATADPLSKQRAQFLQAEKLLNQEESSEYKALRAKLESYPLAAYLDYQALLNNLSQSNSQQISTFIQRYPDYPIAERLNKKWLNQLAQQNQWQEYYNHYLQHPVTGTHYECHNLVAQLHGSSDQKKTALSQAKTYWTVGHSQPDACDPLFNAWMKQSHPSSAEAYERFWLALAENNINLAKYAAKKVTATKPQQQIKQFWDLYQAPETTNIKSLKHYSDEERRIAATLLFKRWYRKQPISATEAWIAQRDKLMPAEQQRAITFYMGARLNGSYHPQAAALSKALDPDFALNDLTERRLRSALASQDWSFIEQAIPHLADEERQDPRWRYWKLVAAMHLRPDVSQDKALNELAQDRSYYGFLAAELNNRPFRLNATSDNVDRQQLDKLAQRPAVARAGELFKLGRLTAANREWNLAQSQMSDGEKQLAGYIAKSWGWHLQAIINAAQTERWDNVDLRFPHPHAKLFKQHAIKNNMDLSFPVAIARQESAFLFNAQSHVGARGLMQLMPKTAKQTAKKHKIPYKNTAELFKPETNITLGAAYLGDMLARFDNNPAYAAAAYNAGPHRVSRWLKERGELPLDIWIETIPFQETRKYVQNVLAFRVIYDQLEGRQASLLTEKQVQLLALNQSNNRTN